MRPTILAAMTAAALMIGVPAPADAGDWRRHYYRDPGVIILPGITMQFGPRYFVPGPRYHHDRRPYWKKSRRWYEPHHRFGPRRHFRHEFRHDRGWRGHRHDGRR